MNTFQLGLYKNAELQILSRMNEMVYHFGSFCTDNLIYLT